MCTLADLFSQIELLDEQRVNEEPKHENHDVDRQQHQHNADQVFVAQSLHVEQMIPVAEN